VAFAGHARIGELPSLCHLFMGRRQGPPEGVRSAKSRRWRSVRCHRGLCHRGPAQV